MSALLLRKLLGKIIAEPAEREDGFRYLRAKTALKFLALLEKEPAPKVPTDLTGGVGAGSTTFRWRALPDETGHYWEETLSFP
jgi:hypothetical protein